MVTREELLDMGLNKLETGNFSGALADFKKSAEMEPGDYNSWLYAGICHNELAEYKEAMAAFEKCIQIDDSLPYAYANLGIVYQRKRDIHEAAQNGDAAAREMIEETGRFLGVACANLVNIFNPEAILFSGGMADAGELLFRPIREEMKRRALEPGRTTVQILRAALPDVVGILGAAGCALNILETSAS